jgi:hypothetical protein
MAESQPSDQCLNESPLGCLLRSRCQVRLAGKQVNTVHAKLARGLLFWCRTKTIEACSDLYAFEADPFHIRHELCLRQSAGDSTRPQINVAANILGQRNI